MEFKESGPKISKGEIANFLGKASAPSNLELGGEKYSAGMVPWWEKAVPNMVPDKFREEYRDGVKGEINPVDVLRARSKMNIGKEVEVKLLYRRTSFNAHELPKTGNPFALVLGPTKEMIDGVASYLYDIGFQPRMRRGQGFTMPGYDSGEGNYPTIYEGVKVKVDSNKMVSLVMSVGE